MGTLERQENASCAVAPDESCTNLCGFEVPDCRICHNDLELRAVQRLALHAHMYQHSAWRAFEVCMGCSLALTDPSQPVSMQRRSSNASCMTTVCMTSSHAIRDLRGAFA